MQKWHLQKKIVTELQTVRFAQEMDQIFHAKESIIITNGITVMIFEGLEITVMLLWRSNTLQECVTCCISHG